MESLESRRLLSNSDAIAISPPDHGIRLEDYNWEPRNDAPTSWIQAGNAAQVGPGGIFTGHLRSGEVDRYTISVSEPGRVTISASAKELDAALKLYSVDDDAARVSLFSDDRSQADNQPMIQGHLSPGNYLIEVSQSPYSDPAYAMGDYAVNITFQTASPPLASMDVGEQEWAIVADDFDDDGDIDLATCNFDSNDVSILINLGDGSFHFNATYSVGQRPVSIVAGDFNGDGQRDLAVENDTDRSISILTGRGDGTFEVLDPLRPTFGDYRLGKPGKIAAGDFNDDDRTDLAVPDDKGFVWLLMGGAEGFLTIEPLLHKEVDIEPSVAVGDINGDEKLDIVQTQDKLDSVVIWLNGGDHLFNPEPWQVVSLSLNSGSKDKDIDGPEAVALADFDNDGRLDFATANDKSNTVSVRLRQDDGTFRDDGENYKAGDDTEFVLSSDFNGDGFPDLVAGNEDSRDLTVLINNQQGGFLDPQSIPVHAIVDELAAGDFDQDGRMDLALVSRENGVTILPGLGDGTFQYDEQSRVGDDPQAIVAGDWNRDGLEDLAVANSRSNDISILLGRGDGSFDSQLRVAVGQVPHAIVSGDLNGDHRLDLVVANENSNDVTILLGLGNGEFVRVDFDDTKQNVQDLRVEFSPSSMVLGNFDDDSILDIATANRLSDDVAILYGLGDGTFQAPVYRSVGSFPIKILSEDFNEDGLLDLGTVNRLSHDVSILFNHDNGHFVANEKRLSSFPPSSSASAVARELEGWDPADSATFRRDSKRFFPRDLVINDFNHDGHDDIAIADDRNDAIFVFLGRGDGSYQSPLWFPTVPDPEDLVSADIDDDGHVDLIMANDSKDTVSILYGLGNGAFRSTNPLRVEEPLKFREEDEIPKTPESLVVADFNNDKRQDLAVAGDNAHKAAVFVQTERREFQRTRVYENVYQGIVAADVTGDGELDLITHNPGTKPDDATIDVLVGDGKGGFGKRVETKTPFANVRSLTATDVDDDGIMDLVAANLGELNVMWVLWGLGNGQFGVDQISLGAESAASTVDYSVRPVVIADFSGDGQFDIATVDETRDQVSILVNTGARSFSHEIITLPTLDDDRSRRGPGTLDASDMNEDGRVDLVIGNRASYDLTVLLSTDIPFEYSPLRIAGRQDATTKINVDLNRDFRDDEVLIDANANRVSAHLNVGNGQLEDSQQLSSSRHDRTQFNDLNDDGIVDSLQVSREGHLLVRYGSPDRSHTFDHAIRLNEVSSVREITTVSKGSEKLLAATTTTIGPSHESEDLIVFFAHPRDPSVVLPQSIRTVGFPTQLAAADLNNDSLDDLVTVEYGQDGPQVVIYMADPDGEFILMPERFAAGNVPGAVTLVDLSPADGWTDIVVVNEDTGDVNVWMNSDGRFTKSLRQRGSNGAYLLDSCGNQNGRNSCVGTGTVGVAIADLNGDGTTDLIATHTNLNSFSILWGKPSGGFRDPSSHLITGAPSDIDVADLNDDGILDLTMVSHDKGTVSSFIGDGHGGFVKVFERTTGRGVSNGLGIFDVDHDGVLDLLIGSDSRDLMVLHGIGDGTFSPPTIEITPSIALTASDVDKDGKVDLVLSNSSDDQIFVKLSDSNQRLTLKSGLQAPAAGSLADLNMDGVDDLIVPNTGGNNILVHLGSAPGFFQEQPNVFFVGTNPVHVAIDDLNKDGLPDLISSNRGSNDISVLFGQIEDDAWTLRNGPRLAAGEGPVSVTVADIANRRDIGVRDGIADILVTNRESGDVYLLRGLGYGFFADQTPVIYRAGDRPFSTIVIDDELLVVNGGSAKITQFVGLDPSRGMRFAAGSGNIIAVVNVDIDDDLDLDLLVAKRYRDGYAVEMLRRDVRQFSTPFHLTSRLDALPRVADALFTIATGAVGSESKISVTFNGVIVDVPDVAHANLRIPIQIDTSLIAARLTNDAPIRGIHGGDFHGPASVFSERLLVTAPSVKSSLELKSFSHGAGSRANGYDLRQFSLYYNLGPHNVQNDRLSLMPYEDSPHWLILPSRQYAGSDETMQQRLSERTLERLRVPPGLPAIDDSIVDKIGDQFSRPRPPVDRQTATTTGAPPSIHIVPFQRLANSLQLSALLQHNIVAQLDNVATLAFETLYQLTHDWTLNFLVLASSCDELTVPVTQKGVGQSSVPDNGSGEVTIDSFGLSAFLGVSFSIWRCCSPNVAASRLSGGPFRQRKYDPSSNRLRS